MKIMASDQLRTKSGNLVEVIYVAPVGRELDLGDAIVGIYTDSDGERSLESWQRDGRYRGTAFYSGLDLVLPAVEPELV